MNTHVTQFGFGDWMPFDPDEQATLVLAHAAVAGAEAIGSARRLARRLEPYKQVVHDEGINAATLDAYLVSVMENDAGWRNLLAERGDGLSVERASVLATSICTFPLVTPLDDIFTASAMRRMDSILDLWNVDDCSWRVQQGLAETIQEMTDQGRSGKGEQVRSLANGARPVAEMLTSFHPVLGFAACQGIEHLGKPDKTLNASDEEADIVGDTGREVARAVLVCKALMTRPEHRSKVMSLRDSLLARARQLPTTDTNIDHLLAGAAALSSIVGAPEDANSLPAMIGRDLAWAKNTLTRLGIKHTVSDGHPSQSRAIFNDTNWVVIHVRNDSSSVHLSAMKRSDRRVEIGPTTESFANVTDLNVHPTESAV